MKGSTWEVGDPVWFRFVDGSAMAAVVVATNSTRGVLCQLSSDPSRGIWRNGWELLKRDTDLPPTESAWAACKREVI